MKRSRGYTIWLVILLSLVIVGLILARTGHLLSAEGVGFRVLAPILNPLDRMGRGFSDLLQTLRDLSDLRERNRQLSELVSQIAAENVRLKEIEAENVALRHLANYVSANAGREFRAAEVRARVIGREPNTLLQYIIIGAGSEQGLAANMPVVTELGLVGYIEQVYPSAARVRLITDADSSVNALVQRTRADGVVRGKVGGRLTLEYLPQGENIVAERDLILTSGLGGGYPRQIVIGQVTRVSQRDYEMFQEAEVQPSVDLNRLEIVLVITNFVSLNVPTATGSDAEGAPTPGPSRTGP